MNWHEQYRVTLKEIADNLQKVIPGLTRAEAVTSSVRGALNGTLLRLNREKGAIPTEVASKVKNLIDFADRSPARRSAALKITKYMAQRD